MTIQAIIYLILLAAIMAETVIIGRAYRKLESLKSLDDLIASSPAVCFVCGGYPYLGTSFQISPAEVPNGGHASGPRDHEYIESHLVYMPDELLR